ncbi:hypothetical protein GCM10012279_59190 [Micromonospora yangpuensis]|nr:hypothetical protein GCM10012279_59190 [Micromonospora yangpuensis]
MVGAGAAAWAASAPGRHGVEEQLGAAKVHPSQVEAHRLTATLLVLLIPYLVGQAIAFAVTARTFPPGVHLWLGYVVVGLFVILLSVAIGWTCGRLLGPVFSALTAALGFLFLTVLLDRVGFVVVSGRPDVAVDPVPVALRLAVVIVLLLALVWAAGTGAGRSAKKRRAAALIPAALLLLLVMATTNVITDRRPPGDRAACLDGSTRLCAWPEHEKYLPQLREVSARVDALPEVFTRPPLINEVGFTKEFGPDGVQYLGDSGPPSFNILEGSPWSYAADIGKAITSSTFGFMDLQNCDWMSITQTDQARLAAVDKWLESYLVGGGTPDYLTNAPEELQRAWAKGRAVAAANTRNEQFRWVEGEVTELSGRYCQPGD